MRIDKFLANLKLISRKDIKKIKNEIFINWKNIEKIDEKINIWDKINFSGNEIIYKENIFLILNKPKNFVSSRVSEWWHRTVYNLISDCIYNNLVEITGRLDADTTGLLLFSSSWEIIHKLINPNKNIYKKYLVKTKNPIFDEEIKKLETWVIIDSDYFTKEAKCEKINDFEIFLSIKEWKFHQIKKMLKAVWNEVIELKRLEIWEIKLGDLTEWKWRYLTKEEENFLNNL